NVKRRPTTIVVDGERIDVDATWSHRVRQPAADLAPSLTVPARQPVNGNPACKLELAADKERGGERPFAVLVENAHVEHVGDQSRRSRHAATDVMPACAVPAGDVVHRSPAGRR